MRIHRMGFALAFAAGTVLAQDPGATFGLKAGWAMAGGDLGTFVDHDATFAPGLQVRFDLHRGHVLMPWMEHATFKGDTTVYLDSYGSFISAPGRAEVKATSLGLDYDYFLSGRMNDGFYVSAGLGAIRTQSRSSGGVNYLFKSNDGGDPKVWAFGALGGGLVLSRHVDLSLRW